MFHFEKKILNNGLRVILVPIKNSQAVTLQILVNTGSKNETKEINGISHFLEHMFFKGTKRRPNPGDIDKELDKIGASHNAFTSSEITGFWIKSSAEHLDIILDIMADIIFNSLFKEEEIEKEKGVILEEINTIEDMPQRKIMDVLPDVVYGDQPIGWPVVGIKETVEKINKTNLLYYQSKNYIAPNVVLIVAGNINIEDSFEKINNLFSGLEKKEIIERKKTKIIYLPNIKILEKKTDQSHLAIGIHAYDMFDERRYALNILSIILGGNTSSKLFMEIRQKLGLAYYVASFSWLQTDSGLMVMRAGISHNNLEKTVKKMVDILSEFKERGVAERELEDAKSFIKGQMALSFETTDEVADFYGEQELFYKKIMQPEEILEKVEKVTNGDILKIAQDIFNPEKINIAVIGKQEDRKKDEELYKNLFLKI
ncbi:MAG: pitrilysin family protein [Patescibacteria group bacterium]